MAEPSRPNAHAASSTARRRRRPNQSRGHCRWRLGHWWVGRRLGGRSSGADIVRTAGSVVGFLVALFVVLAATGRGEDRSHFRPQSSPHSSHDVRPQRLPAPATTTAHQPPGASPRLSPQRLPPPATTTPHQPPGASPRLSPQRLLGPATTTAADERRQTAFVTPPPGFSPPLGFSPPPLLGPADGAHPSDPASAYDDRSPVPTERPWVEWFRPFYGDGMLPPGGTLFGETNLLHPSFYVYGDYRTGIGTGRNAAGRFDNWAHRLNLDLDWQWTATERLHGFIGPLNNGVQFTQLRVEDGRGDLDTVFNPNLVTGFFEGDLGSMLGGFSGTPAEFELPIAAGLVPLLYQNGIWMEDAVTGVSMALPGRHSRLLNWSNFDATAFALFDQINSPAFGRDEHAAQAFGTAWFIDAYGGHIETGWAYVHDRHSQGRSYHNLTAAFTRRYLDRLNNSVRVILNTGQSREKDNRTADGGLLILENSLITAAPLCVVPYTNLFYGWGRPQSVARAELSGGILRNIGILYETDGLNGYPTLDDSANDTWGGAVGLNLLGATLDRQLVLEAAYLNAYGSSAGRLAAGDQYGLGARYQFPISHRTLVRLDTMYGWREQARDLYGARAEFRWKF